MPSHSPVNLEAAEARATVVCLAILAKVDPGPRGEEERLAAIETPEGAEL